MMIEELQLIAGEENPITNSIVTFFSFAIFGLTSLVPTIISKSQGTKILDQGVIIATIVTAGAFLSTLGLLKSCVGGMAWYYSVIETVFIGALAASVAYGIGVAFNA
jgi:VIT1/CCC1 family predicted Fe2+/Mn2+ transporter